MWENENILIFWFRGPLSFSFRFRTQQCSGLLYSHVLTEGSEILPNGGGEFNYSYAYMSHAYLDVTGVTVVHTFLHQTETILLPFSGESFHKVVSLYI